MKIKERTLAELSQDVLGGTTAQAKKKKGLSELSELGQGGVGQDAAAVDVSRTSSLRNALDPEGMLAERREKVERLKQLVQSGQYQIPSSEELAQSIGEEMIFEIMTSGQDKGLV